jgi:hypothetical protein
VLGHGRDIPGEVIVRDVTWTGPAGNIKLVRGLKVPVKAGPQDLAYRPYLAMKKQELDARSVELEPENWRYSTAIKATFVYERPVLGNLIDVSPKQFSTRFDTRLPVFIETDGACAGDEAKRSPGGCGAALCEGKMICKRWSARADTSNNEMEYQAMLTAINMTPRGRMFAWRQIRSNASMV